jgi:hypothetical protein
MGAHATRSASGNKRWMNCPGSIRLSVGRPNESSEAARLGTAAHGLGEYCLKAQIPPSEMVGGIVYLDDEEDAHVIPPGPDAGEEADARAYEALGFAPYPIDSDMADAVQVYYTAVMDELEARPGSELLVEHRTNLSHLVGYDWKEEYHTSPMGCSPNGMYLNSEDVLCNEDGTESAGPMFGTNDAAVLQLFDHLTIFDYKHGQGVVVEVCEQYGTVADKDGERPGMRGNTQLLQYALGTAESEGVKWAFETLDLVIVQPRARHSEGGVRRYSTTKSELQDFKMELIVAAQAVEQPDAPLAAGDWCQFCPAAGIPCPTLHNRVIQIAQLDFSDGEPTVRTVDESTSEPDLEQALAMVPLLDIYVKKVREEGMRRLRESPDGTGFGYKLVRGKANRKFIDGDDPEKVAQALVAKGFPRESLFAEPKLRTPAQVEALRPPELIAALKAQGIKAPVGTIKALVAELSHKPEGKVVMAAMDDPRDPVTPASAAASDFEVVEGED